MTGIPEGAKEEPKSVGFFAAMATVFWSFIGIRSRKGFDADAAGLTPAQVIVAGLIGGAVFVAGIVAFVRFIVWKLGTPT